MERVRAYRAPKDGLEDHPMITREDGSTNYTAFVVLMTVVTSLATLSLLILSH